tara:strand:+ start:615 stop:845 length:231 start_codon:yes stop_codon:yes gene_type:complete
VNLKKNELAMAQKWEYMDIYIDASGIWGGTLKELNSMGDEGWELVGMTPARAAIPEEKGIIAKYETAFLLKRPKET